MHLPRAGDGKRTLRHLLKEALEDRRCEPVLIAEARPAAITDVPHRVAYANELLEQRPTRRDGGESRSAGGRPTASTDAWNQSRASSRSSRVAEMPVRRPVEPAVSATFCTVKTYALIEDHLHDRRDDPSRVSRLRLLPAARPGSPAPLTSQHMTRPVRIASRSLSPTSRGLRSFLRVLGSL